ncbi:MAG: uL22 family ribosomal protein [Nanoarchaeota archaeon]
MVKNEQTKAIEEEKKVVGNLENKGNQSEEISKTKEQEKKEEKTAKKEQEKPKKTEAIINAYNIPVSTKYSIAICKFIKNKKISDAIVDLEQVIKLRKAVPMKGEIPHRKGKRMMSGRFPKLASENFIKILKSLSANAVYNNLEDPIIAEAIANMGVRPYGKFGQVRKKRTHIRLIAKSKNKKGN